jgi:hypothetical protein
LKHDLTIGYGNLRSDDRQTAISKCGKDKPNPKEKRKKTKNKTKEWFKQQQQSYAC